MVKIRLMRRGKKRSPFYRVVVAHSTSPRDGRFIETLGYYNPTKNPAIVQLDEARVMHWLDRGAEPTETTRSILKNEGLLRRWRSGEAPAAAPAAAAEPADAPSEA